VPTFEATGPFLGDYRSLTVEQRALFRAARVKFVDDLRRGSFRTGLRVKGVRGVQGVYEMTWAPDGRATFHFGPSLGQGAHVVWRRIGTHDIFKDP
jgi:hypothetical protein